MAKLEMFDSVNSGKFVYEGIDLNEIDFEAEKGKVIGIESRVSFTMKDLLKF